jgi:hypothetical protein
MQSKWSIIRLAGLGFVGGSVVAMVRILVDLSGTSLSPGGLLWLVFMGGLAGAALLGVAATVRNFFSK